MNIPQISYLLSLATLCSHIVLGILIIVFVFFKEKTNNLQRTLGSYGLILSLVTTLAAVTLSMILSSVVGFPICDLCWWQRVCLFPQTVLLIMAVSKKRDDIINYCLALNIIGVVIALYNNYIVFGGSSPFPCSASGPSCATRLIFEFGYITIPMMSLTIFAFNIFFLLLRKKYLKSSISIKT